MSRKERGETNAAEFRWDWNFKVNSDVPESPEDFERSWVSVAQGSADLLKAIPTEFNKNYS